MIAHHIEARAKGFIHQFERFWRSDLKGLLHASFGLIVLAEQNNVGGALTLNDLKISEDPPLAFDQDLLCLVAQRLARSADGFHSWYRDVVRSFPDQLRKYVSHPFVSSPLILLDGAFKKYQGPSPSYICPSPAHLIWKVQAIPIDAARALAPDWKEADLLKEVGNALSDYLGAILRSTCGAENVIALDSLFAGQADKHADYAVVCGDRALIIESKSSLNSTLGKSIIAPADYVESWARIWGAYVQCARTPRSKEFRAHERLKGVKHFVHIATFEEQICPEGAALNQVARESGLFEKEGFSNAEAVPLQELEDLIVRFGPSRLFDGIVEKWASGAHDHLLSTFMSKQGRPATPHSDRGYLEQAAEQLFGSQKVLDAIRRNDLG